MRALKARQQVFLTNKNKKLQNMIKILRLRIIVLLDLTRVRQNLTRVNWLGLVGLQFSKTS